MTVSLTLGIHFLIKFSSGQGNRGCHRFGPVYILGYGIVIKENLNYLTVGRKYLW